MCVILVLLSTIRNRADRTGLAATASTARLSIYVDLIALLPLRLIVKVIETSRVALVPVVELSLNFILAFVVVEAQRTR